MPAQTYDDLKSEIQRWADNNNVNFVAAIPDFISDAESRFGRLLELQDQECHTATVLTPPVSACALPPGEYEIPHNLVQFQAVYRDDTYLWIYYLKTIPALTDAEPTNWLLSKYPDLYRTQSLVCAEAFLKNDPRIPVWKSQVDEMLYEIENVNQRQRFGGSDLVSRTPDMTARSSAKQQLKLLPLWDFVELPASTSDTAASCRGGHVQGYYTIAGDKLRIWPIPAEATE